MHATDSIDAQSHYADLIAEALSTEGGHLSIGRGGFILWYGDGCRLLGYDPKPIKAACIEAGLPVIDSRGVAFDAVARLVFRGPWSPSARRPTRHRMARSATRPWRRSRRPTAPSAPRWSTCRNQRRMNPGHEAHAGAESERAEVIFVTGRGAGREASGRPVAEITRWLRPRRSS